MWGASLADMLQEALINLHLPKMEVIDVIEVIILVILFYNIAKALRGTRAWILLKGILVLAVIYILAYLIGLKVTVIIFQSILIFLGIALVIIMQPELRRFVEKIGTNKISGSIKDLIKLWKHRKDNAGVIKRYSDDTITELVKACSRLSADKTGALIVIEADIPLNEYIETGIKINSDITSALLINIFEPNTPLHDGAIIIRNNKIISGTCYLPLSDNRKINKDLGTRHRAALGITEITDAIVVVVSEETGAITFAHNGKLYRQLDREGLTGKLKRHQTKELLELNKNKAESWKPTDLIVNNLWLKISSVVIVVMLWGIIINTVNPIVSKTFSGIPINVINENVIGDMNLTYSIKGNRTTNVTLTDRKSNIDSIGATDITVIADLKDLSITNSVMLSASVLYHPDISIELSRTSINVDIEEVITTEIGVDTKLIGNSNNKYFISDIKLDYDTVTISGAKSVINKIGSAVIEINQNTLVSDTSIKCNLQVFDKNGERIDNKLLDISNDTIIADIILYETKEIPINISAVIENDKLKELVQQVDYSTDHIYIAGDREELDSIESLDIEVPIDINIGEVSKLRFIKNIDINEYINNLNIQVPAQYSKVQIELTFNQFNVWNGTVSKEDVILRNVNEDLNYEILTDNINIVAISNKEITDDIKLKLYIDVNNLKNGVHVVRLNLDEQEGLTLYNDVLVEIQVSKN